MSLSARLQARMDSFNQEYHEVGNLPAMERDDLVWEVVNLDKPEKDRHPVIVQGAIIDRFVFNGYYDIKRVGTTDEVVSAQEKLKAAQSKATAQLGAKP